MRNIAFKLSQSFIKKNSNIEYSDNKIIEGIITNSNDTMEFIYKTYYTKIKRMVWSFKNTVLIPEDIFQEGLTRVVINIQSGKFRGDSSFYTYLNSVCRNIALKELSRYRNTELSFDVEMEEEIERYEALAELMKIMNRIDMNCKEIIELRFNLREDGMSKDVKTLNKSMPFEEVALKMNLSVANSRQRFKRCMDKLREMVLNSSELNEYYS